MAQLRPPTAKELEAIDPNEVCDDAKWLCVSAVHDLRINLALFPWGLGQDSVERLTRASAPYKDCSGRFLLKVNSFGCSALALHWVCAPFIPHDDYCAFCNSLAEQEVYAAI